MSEIRPVFTAVQNAATRFPSLLKSAPTGGGAQPAMTSDALDLKGGAGATYDAAQAQTVADTIALMQSTDVRQRFQAIVNMTKMDPATAVPLLQRALQDSDQRVRELAQRALTVMQQMQGAQQQVAATTPATVAPVATPAVPAAPAANTTLAVPTAPAAVAAALPTVTAAAPVPVAAPLPAPSPIAQAGGNTAVVRALEVRLKQGDPNAVAQLAGFAQTDAQEVKRVLLTHIMKSNDPNSVPQAINLLASMKATDAIPYLDAVARHPGQLNVCIEAARNAINILSAQNGGDTTGAAVRGFEPAIKQGGRDAAVAIQQLIPLAEKNRQEVLRVLITHIMKSNDIISVPAAVAALRQIKGVEALPYLQSVVGKAWQTTESNNAVVDGIIALQGMGAAPAAPAAVTPAATPVQPAATQTSTIPSFLRK